MLILSNIELQRKVIYIFQFVVTQCAKKVIKMLIARPRPPLTDRLVFEDGFSFPSGHSITSMAICILAVYFIQTEMKSRAAAKVLSIFIILFGIGIGASRIYLGVHYPTDVLGAWLLSSAAAFAAIAAIRNNKLQMEIKNGEIHPAARFLSHPPR